MEFNDLAKSNEPSEFSRRQSEMVRPSHESGMASMMNTSMNTSMNNQTMVQERMASYRITSFLEEREVPIISSLEQFFPKGTKQDPNLQKVAQGTAPQKMLQVTMTLDRTAQDIIKELKKKMRVLDRASFQGMTGHRQSFGMGRGRPAMNMQSDRRATVTHMTGS